MINGEFNKMLEPKYSAVIKIWDNCLYMVDIIFARPVDNDVLLSLKTLTNYNGFSVTSDINSKTRIEVPLTYDIYKVAEEVESILQEHQFKNLLFIIYNSKRVIDQNVATMKDFVNE